MFSLESIQVFVGSLRLLRRAEGLSGMAHATQQHEPVTVNAMMGDDDQRDDGDGGADPGGLIVHAARYGWAPRIWAAACDSGHEHAGGAKDVADIVRGLIANNELHINPRKEAQYLNRTFWPETARGPAIPRKLAVVYSFGLDGERKTVETPAVPNETFAINITRGGHNFDHYVENLGPRPHDHIPAEDMQGCWGCVCLPGFAAILRKRAEGPDVLVNEGLCFPLLSCFRETWDREGTSNTFRKRGAENRTNYTSAGGPLCLPGPNTWRPAIPILLSCRLCGADCCVQHRRGRAPKISARDLQGCWGCVGCSCVCCLLEHRRAKGEDTLVHKGCYFPLLIPYEEAWHREGDSNIFRGRGTAQHRPSVLEYHSEGGPIIGTCKACPVCTIRLCKTR